MENGDHALLLTFIDEVEKLRTRHHDKIAPMMIKINADIADLMRRVSFLEKETSNTSWMLSHWRDGLIVMLLGLVIYLVRHFGIPTE